METLTTRPTEADIKQTVAFVKKKLANTDINRPVNRAIREGYTAVLSILVENRETYAGIDKLSTQQGRAIAVLGVDYLLGECTQEVLIGVPLKS